MAEPRRVAILHGFSRANAGDGLLVDLTCEALNDAGIARENCTLLALDPESFAGEPHVLRAPGEPSGRASLKLVGSSIEAMASFAGKGRMAAALAGFDALVAVGGGYLVTDSLVRQAGVILNHLAQLRAAARHPAPAIYLPQSIGPLHGPAGHWTRAALAGIDRVWARDDETMRELALANVRRCPDLAVMKLGRSIAAITPQPAGGAVVLVGRDLPACGDYVVRLRELHARLPGAGWAVQADIAGPRSDRAFYRRERLAPDIGTLAAALTQPGGPIVSVRLHGAIAALLAGRPAIHLAYERKGWGAYEDLGLADYVHDARKFDPAIVADQAASLARDPSPFRSRLAIAAPALAGHWRAMVDDLSVRVHSSAGYSG